MPLPPTPPSRVLAATRVDLGNRRALVVDDFHEMRKLLKDMLRTLGVRQIDEVDNGASAMRKLERHAYDLVLCDYDLGEGKNGQQVLEEAKHADLLPYACIFMMVTAETRLEYVMGAVEYQPDDYLIKPFNAAVLRSRIERQIARKQYLFPIEKAMRKQDWGRAVALCEEGLKSHPEGALELLKLKGELLVRKGDHAAARAVYEQVLELRDIPWAQMGLGKIQYLEGELEAARATFEALIDANRNHLEAHDWLARALARLGEGARAQEVLQSAAELSPKVLPRHKALGELAYGNGDLDTAATAFGRAVKLGRYSALKEPSYYFGLARTELDRGESQDALKLLGEAGEHFSGDKGADAQRAALSAIAHQQVGDAQAAREDLGGANALFEAAQAASQGGMSVQAILDLAQAAFLLDDQERGKTLLQRLVRNYHEDEQVLARVRKAFGDAGLAKEGERLIATTRGAVLAINNDGVRLAREGRLEEALKLLRTAAEGLPDNLTINLNAAQVTLIWMQEHGGSREDLQQARRFLDRAGRAGDASAKYRTLRTLLERLTAA